MSQICVRKRIWIEKRNKHRMYCILEFEGRELLSTQNVRFEGTDPIHASDQTVAFNFDWNLKNRFKYSNLHKQCNA